MEKGKEGGNTRLKYQEVQMKMRKRRACQLFSADLCKTLKPHNLLSRGKDKISSI